MLTDDETASIEKLMEIRPEAVPHIRILEFFDSISGSRLVEKSEPVRDKHFADLKQWFFEEIDGGDALLAELETVEDGE